MSEPFSVQIACIQKNAREEIRVQLTEFKGTKFADVRIFANFTAAMGIRSPTPKGVTVSLECLPEFVRAVTEAETQARALGLLTVEGG